MNTELIRVSSLQAAIAAVMIGQSVSDDDVRFVARTEGDAVERADGMAERLRHEGLVDGASKIEAIAARLRLAMAS